MASLGSFPVANIMSRKLREAYLTVNVGKAVSLLGSSAVHFKLDTSPCFDNCKYCLGTSTCRIFKRRN